MKLTPEEFERDFEEHCRRMGGTVDTKHLRHNHHSQPDETVCKVDGMEFAMGEVDDIFPELADGPGMDEDDHVLMWGQQNKTGSGVTGANRVEEVVVEEDKYGVTYSMWNGWEGAFFVENHEDDREVVGI
jgi:hypothetical protein